MSSEDPREREDLCGRQLISGGEGKNLGEKYDKSNWYKNGDEVYCCREVWEGAETDRCIWHAELEGKSPSEILSARADKPERLDRAVLRGVTLSDRISFEGCRLIEADFSDAELGRSRFTDRSYFHGGEKGENFFHDDGITNFGGINFTDAYLAGANLTNAFLEGSLLNRAYLGNVDISGANLSSADLTKTDLREANLTGADLSGGNLTNAFLKGANLTRANLQWAKLNDADLWDADLKAVNLQRSTLVDANLTRANLNRANLFDADLTGARIFGAHLSDVQFNSKTKFGDHYDDANPNKSAWTLRQLERLFQENALPDRARKAYLERKDGRRQQYWSRTLNILRGKQQLHYNSTYYTNALLDGERSTPDPILPEDTSIKRLQSAIAPACQWFRTALYGATMRYGESPLRVVTLSVLTVLTFGVVYPFFGGMDAGSKATTNYGFEPIVAGFDGLPEPVVDVLANLYFSAVTFTTLGYGDIQPATPMVELLATVESFLGALLMALLVFVLGRRATW